MSKSTVPEPPRSAPRLTQEAPADPYDVRAAEVVARAVALEKFHEQVRQLLLRRARRAAPRGRDWQRIEQLVLAVPATSST